MTVTTQPLTQQCHDSFTLARHWVTAANVIFLFASVHIREPLERGTPLKKRRWAGDICCALFPHYLLRDSILRRMLPCRSFR